MQPDKPFHERAPLPPAPKGSWPDPTWHPRDAFKGQDPDNPWAAMSPAEIRSVQNDEHDFTLHNLEAEMDVLGCCLLDYKKIAAAADILEPRDFYRPVHQELFAKFLEMDAAGEVPDETTIPDALGAEAFYRIGAQPYLLSLTFNLPSSANVRGWARIVKRYSRMRRATDQAEELRRMLLEGKSIAEIDLKVAEIRQDLQDNSKSPFSWVSQSAADFKARIDSGDVEEGLSTGFYQLDQVTGGLMPDGEYVFCARPGQGKTILGCAIARHVAKNYGSVLVFSLDMPARALTERWVSGMALIDYQRVRKSSLMNEDEKEHAKLAADDLAKLPICVCDDPSLTVLQLGNRAKQMQDACGMSASEQRLKALMGDRAPVFWQQELKLVVVDYLGRIKGSKESRVQEVAEIARAIKELQRQLQIPVIALAQPSRGIEKREDKRPMLSDLKDSSAIEEEADFVGFIHHPNLATYKTLAPHERSDPQPAEIYVEKNRNGWLGLVEMKFIPAFVNFEDVERRYEDPGY